MATRPGQWDVISYTAVLACYDGRTRHAPQVALEHVGSDPTAVALENEGNIMRSRGRSEGVRGVKVIATDTRARAHYIFCAYDWCFTSAGLPHHRVVKLMTDLGIDDLIELFNPTRREAVRAIAPRVADEMDVFNRDYPTWAAKIHGPIAA